MGYKLAADAVVVFHLLFIAFVMSGALLALRWRWMVWLHLPAVAWGMAVEFLHLYCPLTPWENVLRMKAGAQGYSDDFIGHYLLPLIYPAGLTPQIQTALGAVVLLVNLIAYRMLICQSRRRRAGV